MTHIIDDDIAWSREKMLKKIIAGFQTLPRFGFGFGKLLCSLYRRDFSLIHLHVNTTHDVASEARCTYRTYATIICAGLITMRGQQ